MAIQADKFRKIPWDGALRQYSLISSGKFCEMALYKSTTPPDGIFLSFGFRNTFLREIFLALEYSRWGLVSEYLKSPRNVRSAQLCPRYSILRVTTARAYILELHPPSPPSPFPGTCWALLIYNPAISQTCAVALPRDYENYKFYAIREQASNVARYFLFANIIVLFSYQETN